MKEKLLKLGYYFIPFYSFVNLVNLLLSFIYTDKENIEFTAFTILKIFIYFLLTIVSLSFINKKKFNVLPVILMIVFLIVIQVYGSEISNLIH